MQKAIQKHIDRRAVIKSAAITTAAGIAAAASLRATIAHAATVTDPIFALIAECDRLRAAAEAAAARAKAAADSVNRDCDGCGSPPLDESKRELRPVIEWVKAQDAERLARFGRESEPGAGPWSVNRYEMEQFNRQAELADLQAQAANGPKLMMWVDDDGIAHHNGPRDVSQQTQANNAARLEWLDRRQAERERNAEVSGYRDREAETEELWSQYSDACVALMDAEPVTIAGAMAQLRIAVDGIKDAHTTDGEFSGDFDNYGVFNAYDALARLLPQEQVA
jgi:hypothetical protein